MPELPNQPAERERAIREAVCRIWQETAGAAWKVYPRPRYADSESRWVELATIPVNGHREARIVMCEFAGFAEKEAECLSTIVTLRYRFDVRASFVDERRGDNSNSHDDYVSFVMRARQAFKSHRELGFARGAVWHTLLRTVQEIDVRAFDDTVAHSAMFALDVETRF